MTEHTESEREQSTADLESTDGRESSAKSVTDALSVSNDPVSKRMGRVGWVLSGAAVLYLLFSAVPRIAGVSWAVDPIVDLGYPEHLVVALAFVLLGCTILYVIPRTAVFGAILLTGYLGGAVAANVRVEEPLFFFPVLLGALLWGGLYLRNDRLRRLVPLQRSP